MFLAKSWILGGLPPELPSRAAAFCLM